MQRRRFETAAALAALPSAWAALPLLGSAGLLVAVGASSVAALRFGPLAGYYWGLAPVLVELPLLVLWSDPDALPPGSTPLTELILFAAAVVATLTVPPAVGFIVLRALWRRVGR